MYERPWERALVIQYESDGASSCEEGKAHGISSTTSIATRFCMHIFRAVEGLRCTTGIDHTTASQPYWFQLSSRLPVNEMPIRVASG